MNPRDILARQALRQIPKILTLQDRNPHSPTYGSFDRNHWHYRIIDFPSGMAQEMAWPLALVYSLDLPYNPYRGNLAIAQWVEAGIRYGARSAHRDGSCDDYFANERAGGAASFSLLGFIEAEKLLELDDPEILDFFARRARWLSGFHEAGQLTNHHALVALCLDLLGRRLGTSEWEAARDQRLERILEWQHEEGWFQEYEGCDLGYQTITTSLLAWVHQLNPRVELQESLERSVRLIGTLMYPDGSYGGELGSRNTYNYFPHGLEVIGRWMPEALAINDRHLLALEAGLGAAHEDDHHLGHHVWNHLLAWRDYVENRPTSSAEPSGRTWLPAAGLLVDHRQGSSLYVSTRKGGVFRLYEKGALRKSDTHLSILVSERERTRNAVAHMVANNDVLIDEDRIVVSGQFRWAKHESMTTAKLIVLRIFMATLGRFVPNLVRALLQRKLIVGASEAPFRFRRIFEHREPGWLVTDEIEADSWENVVSVGRGASQASIYVTMSRTFQVGQLCPWMEEPRRAGDADSGQDSPGRLFPLRATST